MQFLNRGMGFRERSPPSSTPTSSVSSSATSRPSTT